MAGSDSHADRAARNEALFRRVNERVEEVNKSFQRTPEDADFFCECADIGCTETIAMTLPEYEALRDASTRFAVKVGHVLPENETVIEKRAGYIVVEKIGRAGERADHLDPRD